jgi:hypothetical protein
MPGKVARCGRSGRRGWSSELAWQSPTAASALFSGSLERPPVVIGFEPTLPLSDRWCFSYASHFGGWVAFQQVQQQTGLAPLTDRLRLQRRGDSLRQIWRRVGRLDARPHCNRGAIRNAFFYRLKANVQCRQSGDNLPILRCECTGPRRSAWWPESA